MQNLKNHTSKNISRDSQMELLRIIAMSMILIHHFLYYGVYPVASDHVLQGLPIPQNALIYSGVNLFVLISGYYGMRLSWKSVVKLALLILFFKFSNLILAYLYGGRIEISGIIRETIFPFSGKYYWFISIYFLLMVTVPIINPGLKSATLRQLRIIAGILTFVILYSGGFGNNIAASAGFEYPQFLYLYVCGYYIHKETALNKINKFWFLVAFFVICFIDFILAYLEYHFLGKVFCESKYNFPFVIFAAFSLFIFFSKLQFKSRIINKIAGCSFGCYLIQEGMFGKSILYPIHQKVWIETDTTSIIARIFLSFILLWIGSFILTSFANLWIPKAANWLSKKFHRLNKWIDELSE